MITDKKQLLKAFKRLHKDFIIFQLKLEIIDLFNIEEHDIPEQFFVLGIEFHNTNEKVYHEFLIDNTINYDYTKLRHEILNIIINENEQCQYLVFKNGI
jgi:hypothetical protein